MDRIVFVIPDMPGGGTEPFRGHHTCGTLQRTAKGALQVAPV